MEKPYVEAFYNELAVLVFDALSLRLEVVQSFSLPPVKQVSVRVELPTCKIV